MLRVIVEREATRSHIVSFFNDLENNSIRRILPVLLSHFVLIPWQVSVC